MRRRTWTLAALAIAPVVALTACTPAVPKPVAAVPAQETSAVTQVQIDRIVPATFDELAAADAATDPNLFGTRIAGDAAQVRGMQYRLAGTAGPQAVDVIPSDMQAVYVTDAETWPRIMVGVTEAPDDTTTPVVVLWVQQDVESDYQMVGWAHMLPGATLPAMAGVSVGAPMVSLDDPDLNPGQVIDSYTDLLANGASSPYYEGTFEPDGYRDQVFTNRAGLNDIAATASGSYSETYTADKAASYAIATSDGGALVFAPVTAEGTFTVSEGATVTLSAVDAAIISGEVSTTVKHTYRDLVVFSIPAGGDVKPAVVAADHQLIAVSAG